jgi:acylphosphatase
MPVAAHLRIEGRVQGVGYRAWLMREASRSGLRGWVRNRLDGSVEALLIGNDEPVERVIAACRTGPIAARVTRIERISATDDGSTGFLQLPTA